MRQKKFVSCASIIEGSVRPLLESARKLQRLEEKICLLLPEGLAEHFSVMNLRNGILTLSTTTPAWAARLRFSAPELLTQLTTQYKLQLQTVQVRILPQSSPDAEPACPNPMKLSMQNATLLAKTARTINHPELQEALYRLATNVRGI